MRGQKPSLRVVVSLGMGLVGTVILIVALPSWLLFSLLGTGLLAGAYFIYQSRIL